MLNGIDDAIAKLAAFDSFIESALQNEVAEAAKDAVAQSTAINVYGAYTPKVLYSRRGSNGGLSAEDNIECIASGKQMTVRNVTGLQNLYGGNRQEILTNIVESGSYSYHMHLAGPRPFMEDAKQLLLNGPGQQALHAGLARQGIILD